jgi:hypothetical protein
MALSPSSAASAAVGGWIFKIASAPSQAASKPDTTVAPASAYWPSVKDAAAPAPLSTRTWKPFLVSSATVLGVCATRISPGNTSFGTPERREEGREEGQEGGKERGGGEGRGEKGERGGMYP